MLGRDGFIFLGGPDTNEVGEYIAGRKQISRPALNVHRRNLDVLKSLHCPATMLVVPEAHVVYRDLLPATLSCSMARPISILINDNPNQIIYPIREFDALRRSGMPIYTGKDSHWSEPAARAAYKICRAAHGISEPFVEEYPADPNNEVGDLTVSDPVLGLKLLYERLTYIPTDFAPVVMMNGIVNHGHVTVRVNPKAPLGRALCFGTSFSRHLMPCYAMDFRELVFCYGTAVDQLLVQLVRPDHVFVELPERFVHMPFSGVAGAVFTSHALQFDASKAMYNKLVSTKSPLSEFVDIFRSLSIKEIPNSIPTEFDVCKERLSFLFSANLSPIHRDVLRTIFAGSFRRDSLIGYMHQIIDAGHFTGLSHLFPETEMGLLARIRINILEAELELAMSQLNKLLITYDASVESRYYENYLRARGIVDFQ